MAVAYFDSSAMVKLLVEEDGSDLASELWSAADAVAASRIAYPEVRAALAAALRTGRLDPLGRRSAEKRWETFWAATRVVELTPALARHAGRLAGEHALRGADAIHLASALALGQGTVVVVWDMQLRGGARRAGLRTAPVTA